jgi:NAD(P)-dependent dehydrogenase (short-subunit alcohol dehydrogenase family)
MEREPQPFPGRLDGAIAVITGAAHGIGSASASRLGSEGAVLWLVDVDGKALDAVTDQLRAENIEVHSRCRDVADPDTWTELADEVRATHGRLDILHTNAYAKTLARLHEASAADWDRQIAVNLSSVFHTLRALMPMLVQARGSVIFTSSVHGIRGVPEHPAYAAGKGALLALMRQLAVDYGPEVRVNAVVPGPVFTAAWDRVTEPDRQRSVEQTTLKRFGRPEDVAAAVAFLASADASFITGTSIIIDGGWSISVDSA